MSLSQLTVVLLLKLVKPIKSWTRGQNLTCKDDVENINREQMALTAVPLANEVSTNIPDPTKLTIFRGPLTMAIAEELCQSRK